MIWPFRTKLVVSFSTAIRTHSHHITHSVMQSIACMQRRTSSDCAALSTLLNQSDAFISARLCLVTRGNRALCVLALHFNLCKDHTPLQQRNFCWSVCDAYGATKRVAARITTRPSSYGTVWYVMIERISTFPAVDALIERHIHICDNYIHITPHHTYIQWIYISSCRFSPTLVHTRHFTSLYRALYVYTAHILDQSSRRHSVRALSFLAHVCTLAAYDIELNKKKNIFKKNDAVLTHFTWLKKLHTHTHAIKCM